MVCHIESLKFIIIKAAHRWNKSILVTLLYMGGCNPTYKVQPHQNFASPLLFCVKVFNPNA